MTLLANLAVEPETAKILDLYGYWVADNSAWLDYLP